MKRLLLKYKKVIAGALVFLLAIECRVFDRITIGAYEVQKKVICRRIFSQLEGDLFYKDSSNYGVVYFTSEDKNYTKMILEMVDIYYPMIANDFCIEPEQSVSIVVYPSKELMGSAIGLEGGEVPMGAYYGGILNILSPRLWIKAENDSETIDYFLEEGPMVHEMVHLVLDKRLKGAYDIWFTEGVALYYENKYTGFEWRPDLNKKNKAVTAEQLKNGFHILKEDIAYRRSFEIIQEIIAQKGEKGLQNAISEMAGGKSFYELFQSN